MTDRVKWGILGNSTIARKCVIRAIQKSRNGLVHALGTRSPADATEVVAKNGIKTVYDSYGAVLADPAVDAVYIPLPNHMHLPWTLKALSAGKHVLCEKPLACTAGEACEMAARAKETGLLLMKTVHKRFHQQQTGLLRPSRHLTGLPGIAGQRLFTQHMLAGGQSFQRPGKVHMIRQRHIDGIDGRICQQPIIAVINISNIVFSHHLGSISR